MPGRPAQLSALEATLTGQLTQLTTDVGTIASDISALQAALAAAVAALSPGSAIQASDIAALQTISNNLASADTALQTAIAAAAVPPPPAPAEPPVTP